MAVASSDAVDSPTVAAVAFSVLDALVVLSNRAQSPALPDVLLRSSHLVTFVNGINDPALDNVVLARPGERARVGAPGRTGKGVGVCHSMALMCVC